MVTWLDTFIADLKHADLSARTVAGYQDDVERFLRWFHQTKDVEARLETLHTDDIINYRRHLERLERFQPATINRRLQLYAGCVVRPYSVACSTITQPLRLTRSGSALLASR